VADLSASADAVRQISPLHQAERIHAPLLLAWGEKDSRTPPKQVEPLVSRLEALGRPPEVVTYAGEGHGWLKVETRLDFARRLEAFLARSLGGAEAPR
jgi:dipeptidyl aminopeptidase/acylaminoacyl peptidase